MDNSQLVASESKTVIITTNDKNTVKVMEKIDVISTNNETIETSRITTIAQSQRTHQSFFTVLFDK
jgi:hypothetical protein